MGAKWREITVLSVTDIRATSLAHLKFFEERDYRP